MDKQIIINQAVKRYRGLDEILRRKMPEDEEAAFLQGRMLELMLLIYALDEQAIVLNLEGKGLVVITACTHSGVLNTLEHVQNLTGIDKVYAVIGGFHLTGAPDENIGNAISNIKKFKPAFVIGGHCTGLVTIFQMMHSMPEQFHISSSGTIVDFKA